PGAVARAVGEHPALGALLDGAVGAGERVAGQGDVAAVGAADDRATRSQQVGQQRAVAVVEVQVGHEDAPSGRPLYRDGPAARDRAASAELGGSDERGATESFAVCLRNRLDLVTMPRWKYLGSAPSRSETALAKAASARSTARAWPAPGGCRAMSRSSCFVPIWTCTTKPSSACATRVACWPSSTTRRCSRSTISSSSAGGWR